MKGESRSIMRGKAKLSAQQPLIIRVALGMVHYMCVWGLGPDKYLVGRIVLLWRQHSEVVLAGLGAVPLREQLQIHLELLLRHEAQVCRSSNPCSRLRLQIGVVDTCCSNTSCKFGYGIAFQVLHMQQAAPADWGGRCMLYGFHVSCCSYFMWHAKPASAVVAWQGMKLMQRFGFG